MTGSAEELLAGLDRGGVRRAVVFSTAEPDGYPAANDRVLAEVAASDGRLVAFARVDPNADAPLEVARRGIDAGARGIKLHPRSDDFALPHPEVEALVAFAAERRLPVLFHAGRGIPALGEEVIRLAGEYPGARIILAHAGDQRPRAAPARRRDAAQRVLRHVVVAGRRPADADDGGPAGADPVRQRHAVRQRALRRAHAAALRAGGRALAARAGGMAGAQIERLLAGEEPLDAGPALGPHAVGHRWLAGERIVSYSSAALQLAFRGGDPARRSRSRGWPARCRPAARTATRRICSARATTSWRWRRTCTPSTRSSRGARATRR